MEEKKQELYLVRSENSFGMLIPIKDGFRRYGEIVANEKRDDKFPSNDFNLSQYFGSFSTSTDPLVSVDQLQHIGSHNLGKRNIVYSPQDKRNFDFERAKELRNSIADGLRTFDKRASQVQRSQFPMANGYILSLEVPDQWDLRDIDPNKYRREYQEKSGLRKLIDRLTPAKTIEEDRTKVQEIIGTANFYVVRE